MSKQADIVECINDIKNHYDVNLNNKYVKNIILKLDLASETRHNMGVLLDYKTLYFDSKGTMEDLYASVSAINDFVKEVKIKVLNNISNYTSTSVLSGSAAKDPKEQILYQMAVKNYPMNVVLLAKKVVHLLGLVKEYDELNFNSAPAYKSFSELDQIEQSLNDFIAKH